MCIINRLILKNKERWFVEHIQNHLDKEDRGCVPSKITKGKVGCTICGRDIDEIAHDKVREIFRYLKLKGVENL